MDEYLKRDDVLNCFHDWIDKRGDVHTPDEMAEYRAIEKLPTADVTERKTGKWTLNKDGSGTCSECGRKQYNCWDLDNSDNYCHHCGTRMVSDG